MNDAERLEVALRRFFSANRGAAGREDYFGVSGRSPQRPREFTIDFTFRRGERYCCFEPACHLGIQDVAWWRRLRALLNPEGFADLWPLCIEFQVTVEKGALCGEPRPWPDDEEVTDRPSRAYTYLYGQAQEVQNPEGDDVTV